MELCSKLLTILAVAALTALGPVNAKEGASGIREQRLASSKEKEKFLADAERCLENLEAKFSTLFQKSDARFRKADLCRELRGGWFFSFQETVVSDLGRLEMLLNLRTPAWVQFHGTRETRLTYKLTPSIGNTWDVEIEDHIGRREGPGKYYLWARDMSIVRVVRPFQVDSFDWRPVKLISCKELQRCRANYVIQTCQKFSPRTDSQFQDSFERRYGRDFGLLVLATGSDGDTASEDYLKNFELVHSLSELILRRVLEKTCDFGE